jgi:hypothetical protein
MQYRESLKEKLSDPNLAPNKYWSLVKGIYGSKKGMGIPVLEDGNKQLSTSVDKARAFTDYFKSQQTLLEPVGHQLLPLIRNTNLCLTEVTTTPGEVKKLLNHLNWEKHTGWMVSHSDR